MAFSFLKVLLGTGRFKVLEARWEKMKGAAVAGNHCCVALPLFPFLFFLGMFFAVALAFFLCLNCCIGVVAILI
jgi:hypothetical protein